MKNFSKVVIWAAMLLVSVSTLAAKPLSDQQKWANILTKVVNEGEQSLTPIGTYIVYQDLAPNNPNENHIANHLSAVGSFNNDGDFLLRFVDAVWEKWTLNDDGDWQLDQWIYRLDNDGNYLNGMHYYTVLSKVPSRRVSDLLPTPNQWLLQKWTELHAGWLAKGDVSFEGVDI